MRVIRYSAAGGAHYGIIVDGVVYTLREAEPWAGRADGRREGRGMGKGRIAGPLPTFEDRGSGTQLRRARQRTWRGCPQRAADFPQAAFRGDWPRRGDRLAGAEPPGGARIGASRRHRPTRPTRAPRGGRRRISSAIPAPTMSRPATCKTATANGCAPKASTPSAHSGPGSRRT